MKWGPQKVTPQPLIRITGFREHRSPSVGVRFFSAEREEKQAQLCSATLSAKLSDADGRGFVKGRFSLSLPYSRFLGERKPFRSGPCFFFFFSTEREEQQAEPCSVIVCAKWPGVFCEARRNHYDSLRISN